MNLIVKEDENVPDCLRNLEADQALTYEDLKDECRTEVLEALKKEQSGICAYCDRYMNTIRIEHFVPQSFAPQKDLSYKNFLGVCFGIFFFDRKENKGIIYCEKRRGNERLVFDPLNQTHTQSIYFDSTGHVKSTDPKLQSDFDEVLNLNFEEIRKERLDSFRREVDNLVEFCEEFKVTRTEGISKMLRSFKSISHKRFLQEKFEEL